MLISHAKCTNGTPISAQMLAFELYSDYKLDGYTHTYINVCVFFTTMRLKWFVNHWNWWIVATETNSFQIPGVLTKIWWIGRAGRENITVSWISMITKLLNNKKNTHVGAYTFLFFLWGGIFLQPFSQLNKTSWITWRKHSREATNGYTD